MQTIMDSSVKKLYYFEILAYSYFETLDFEWRSSTPQIDITERGNENSTFLGNRIPMPEQKSIHNYHVYRQMLVNCATMLISFG